MATEIAEAESRIQAIVAKKPELGGKAAAKLAKLADELENLSLDGGSSGSTPFDKIQQGWEKFKTKKYVKDVELTNKLKTGQWPKLMVVACADSRVSPTLILGLKPGDAFIIRNVANMVPAYEKEGCPSMGSALEYAVLHLKVDHILVIGHRACGGIGALVKMTPDDGNYTTTFIEKWVEIGKPARAAVTSKLVGEQVDAICKTCEKESVNNSLTNMLSYPFLESAVSEGKISLHGGYYDHIEGLFETWGFENAHEVDKTVTSIPKQES